MCVWHKIKYQDGSLPRDLTGGSTDKRTVIACSDQSADLRCGKNVFFNAQIKKIFIVKLPVSPSEKGSIRIIKSNYGRLDKNTCTDEPSNVTYCAAPDFQQLTKNMYVYVNDPTCQVPD